MGRWLPDAQGRLTDAALELYAEHGFEQTTVAEIAERAGVTERTFFRYFTDKREVLFSGSEYLLEVALVAIAEAEGTAIDRVAAAIMAIGAQHEPNREYARRRAAVVAANTSLQERELLKMWHLGDQLGTALREQGIGQVEAGLAADAGASIYRLGFAAWVADGETRGLVEIEREYFAQLKGATAGA